MNNLTQENVKIMDDSKGKRNFQVILKFSSDRCFLQSDLRNSSGKKIIVYIRSGKIRPYLI